MPKGLLQKLVVNALENKFQVDIDGDGRIGSQKLSTPTSSGARLGHHHHHSHHGHGHGHNHGHGHKHQNPMQLNNVAPQQGIGYGGQSPYNMDSAHTPMGMLAQVVQQVAGSGNSTPPPQPYPQQSGMNGMGGGQFSPPIQGQGQWGQAMGMGMGMGQMNNQFNGNQFQQQPQYNQYNSNQMQPMRIQQQPTSGQHFNPQFNPQATRKALLIGINYFGTPNQLRGCVNDVAQIRQFLLNSGWTQDGLLVMVDDQSWGTQMPTRTNIIQAMSYFASTARPGDHLFFHYSGHGGKVVDTSGDEKDGFDETIMPCDFRTAGQIIDDEIFARLVAPLPAGCRMFALMDSCNSGTAMDLPYHFVGHDHIMGQIFSNGMFNPAMIPQMITNQALKSSLAQIGNQLMKAAFAAQLGQHKKHSFADVVQAFTGMGGHNDFTLESNNRVRADVVCIGGCEDGATSADVQGPKGAGGACTNAFLNTFNANRTPTYIELLEHIRQEIQRRGLKQKPQLSSGKQIDMSGPLLL